MPAEQRATETVHVRTTSERKAKLERLAVAAGLSLTAWIERQIDRAREA